MRGQDTPAGLPEQPAAPTFPGFESPRFTQVPDQVIDELMADLSGAELKVLLYVVRRTFGFGKDADAISVSQMADGITKRDGTVLDRGTGLARSSIRKATASLVEKGILTVRQVQDESGEYESNVYALRMRGVGRESDHPSSGVGRESDHPSPKIDRGVVRFSDPQQTVVQETVSQESEPTPIAPTADDLALVDAVVADVAAELRDEAPPPATRRRAREGFAAASIPFDDWLGHVDYARRIAKRSGGTGQQSRMWAFWRALDARLGAGERRTA